MKNKDTEESFRIQIKKLEAKIKNIERSSVIALRYAKEIAKEKAEKMMNERLQKARDAYQREFQNMCEQYEQIKHQLE